MLAINQSRPSYFGLTLLVLATMIATFFEHSTASSQAIDSVEPNDSHPGETYIWRPVAIGAGGFITGFDSDRTGVTRVVRTDVYGAYLWIESEQRWAQLVVSSGMPSADLKQNGAAEGVYEIAVAPNQPDRIYMALKGHIYRSNDRGRVFARVSNSKPFPIKFDPNSDFRHHGSFFAVSPSDADVVLFGTPGNGLLRTDDGGVTWEAAAGLPSSADAEDKLKIEGASVLPWFEKSQSVETGRTFALSPGNGVFLSNDKGRNFKELVPRDAPQPKMVKHGVFGSDGTFFVIDSLTDSAWRFQGGHWLKLPIVRSLRSHKLASIAINPRDGKVFVFEEGGVTYVSPDGGQRWSILPHRARAGEGDPPWLRVSNQSYFAISRVVFDPVVPNRLIGSAGTGVYYADILDDPRAIIWTSRSRGIEELVANDVVHVSGQSPVFAAWDFGIHVKPNLDAFSTTYGPKERVVIAAQQLDWSAADAKFLVTNASDTRTFCCSGDGDSVLAGFSEDAGLTWQRFPSLPTPPGTQSDDPWRMSFGTIAVSSGDTRNIIWEPSNNRSAFYTKDRGFSWRKVYLPGEKLPYTGSHSKHYYARKTLAADRVLSGVFYYYHSGSGSNERLKGLWRTDSGGSSWRQVFDREIAPQSGYSAKLRTVPDHAGHIFFTTGIASGSDTRLRRSIDGGEQWTIVPNVDHVDDIGFGKHVDTGRYPTIFVSGRVLGNYGIWRSTDNGISWKLLSQFPVGTLDQVTVIEGDKDVFGRVFVGYKGSGWRYGTSEQCIPKPYSFPQTISCTAIQ